jgi:hypothetical protein
LLLPQQAADIQHGLLYLGELRLISDQGSF